MKERGGQKKETGKNIHSLHCSLCSIAWRGADRKSYHTAASSNVHLDRAGAQSVLPLPRNQSFHYTAKSLGGRFPQARAPRPVEGALRAQHEKKITHLTQDGKGVKGGEVCISFAHGSGSLGSGKGRHRYCVCGNRKPTAPVAPKNVARAGRFKL